MKLSDTKQCHDEISKYLDKCDMFSNHFYGQFNFKIGFYSDLPNGATSFLNWLSTS